MINYVVSYNFRGVLELCDVFESYSVIFLSVFMINEFSFYLGYIVVIDIDV